MRRVWPKGWLGWTVRMVGGTFRQQMSCEGGEVLGGRRFVLLARERIWTGRGFAIHQIVFDWGWCWGGVAWFVRDWGDIVVGRWAWCWEAAGPEAAKALARAFALPQTFLIAAPASSSITQASGEVFSRSVLVCRP